MKKRNIRILFFCTIMGIYLCSCEKNTEAVKGEVKEDSAEISTETEDAEVEIIPEVEKSTDYIDDVVTADLNPNDYTHIVSMANDITGEYTLVSYVVDLDNDGTDEAFVLEVYWNETNNSPLTEDSTFEATRLWFVDEKGDATNLTDFAKDGPVSVHETLRLVTIGDNSYVFVSAYGQMAAYDQTVIYTEKYNAITNATDLPCYGSKYFVDGDVVWYKEMYGMQIDREDDLPLIDSGLTMGHCFIPYHLYLDDSDNTFKLYGAKEISLEEAEEITGLDFSDILSDATEYEFILRDNNQLDVNIATACEPSFNDDGESYEFICYSYFLQDNGQWESDDYIEGYYLIDPVEFTNVWDFLQE
ncbi:hypothetical protein CSX00_09165 [Pseudobutyrivibrio ruminis]|uniref:Uncharacterized protein n=1 Tax=Pseudobutyrivibrio ruminis TaxID=46206 RepID=A0A2G3EAG7_9FIRM|nr:hypothetical protein CSX00_09165 [Pseudobutyrivibrio ruminis]